MAEWQVGYPVDYSSASDENIDSLTQKYIAEVERVYTLLGRLRRLDGSATEQTDTVANQFKADYVTNTLFLRNMANDGWIELGKLTEHFGHTPAYIGAVANSGGVPSIQVGLLADRPATEKDGAVYIASDKDQKYRYSTTAAAWIDFGAIIKKNAAGKIIGNLAGNADTATTADTAAYAATAGETERASSAVRLENAVNINGVAFDGTRSINIGIAGSADDEIAGYQSLLWRTTQNERELSNVALFLEAQGYYPDYNSLLPIDFVGDTSKLDMAATTILSSTSGDNTLNVESLANIKKGAMYTISDGSKQEDVQVADVAKNGTTLRVILKQNLVNIYTDGLARMYRTTAGIRDGKAYGPETNCLYSIPSSITWSGTNANVSVTVPMVTTAATADQFTASSSIEYTADGMITLSPSAITGIALITTGGGAGTWASFEGEVD